MADLVEARDGTDLVEARIAALEKEAAELRQSLAAERAMETAKRDAEAEAAAPAPSEAQPEGENQWGMKAAPVPAEARKSKTLDPRLNDIMYQAAVAREERESDLFYHDLMKPLIEIKETFVPAPKPSWAQKL